MSRTIGNGNLRILERQWEWLAAFTIRTKFGGKKLSLVVQLSLKKECPNSWEKLTTCKWNKDLKWCLQCLHSWHS
jgi:hypothetical protein